MFLMRNILAGTPIRQLILLRRVIGAAPSGGGAIVGTAIVGTAKI